MTAIEYRKTIDAIPLNKRLLIKDELNNAYMAINRIECLLIEKGIRNWDIPVLEDQHSLSSSIWTLIKIFDTENYPDTRL